MSTRRIIETPDKVRRAIHTKLCAAVVNLFPINTGDLTATVSNVTIKEKEPSYSDQSIALMRKGNIAEGVYCDIDVMNSTNNQYVCSIKNHRILNVPWYTSRGTLIVDGNEYAIISQMRTKSGVYTRKRGNDELESSFNLAKGANFKLLMNPENGTFKIDMLGNTMPALAVLKILGASPADISGVLGNELYSINAELVTNSAMDRTRNVLYNKLVSYKNEADTHLSDPEKDEAIRHYFSTTEIDPETTKLTLGQPIKAVNAQSILLAMKKLLAVYKGEDEIDERDHLEFQKIMCIEDLLAECVTKAKDTIRKIHTKLQAVKLDAPKEEIEKQIKSCFSPAYFTAVIRRFITCSDIARTPSQINPMEFADTASIVTRLGEGAIGTLRAVPFGTRITENRRGFTCDIWCV